jgi:putative phosphoesterase
MDQHIVRNLSTVSQGTNVIFEQNIVEVQLENGKKLAATHGDNSYVMDNLVYSREFDYVCHGHTHRISDSRIDNTRIICPGAVSGPRYPDFPTVAVLDSKSDSLEFYNIDNPAKAFRI